MATVDRGSPGGVSLRLGLDSSDPVLPHGRSDAGKRIVAVPASIVPALRVHLDSYAEAGSRGRMLVGRGLSCRSSLGHALEGVVLMRLIQFLDEGSRRQSTDRVLLTREVVDAHTPLGALAAQDFSRP